MMERHKIVVFDLDDTLYKEIDFLKSAYREIADFLMDQYHVCNLFDEMLTSWRGGENVFAKVIDKYRMPLCVEDLLKMYREHRPKISLDKDTYLTLDKLSQTCQLGIITDGRSMTQREKVAALGLKQFVVDDNILISEETGFEKPAQEPFRFFMEKYPDSVYAYVADNSEKDFLAPNILGWTTACLQDDGRNIHQQDFHVRQEYRPMYKIDSLSDLLGIIS